MPVMPTDVLPVESAPAAPAEVAPAEDTGELQPPEGGGLPEEVLKIPAIGALLQGAPPATYGPLDAKTPEIKTLNKHADDLKTAGFAAFKSESMPGNFVLFNGLIVTPEEVQQADKSGQLDSIAVPFQTLVDTFEKAKHGMEGDGSPEAPAPGPETLAPAGASAPPPPPASAQKRLMGARVTNLAPGSPTSGPAPGRGRVLNAISKPVV